MNNISKIKQNECCGCSACFNACPNNSIRMIEDNEGFLFPSIDSSTCTNCGLCLKACPLNNFENCTNTPVCYVGFAKDNMRENSSSGGFFPTIAHWFVENGGYVSGAVWDEKGKVQHIISNKIDDILKMQKSKYLQSNIGKIYVAIQELLNLGHNVLFTGTPCQVAGLRKYLNKSFENLYCIDIICHGTPSPKIFQQHIQEVEVNPNEKWLRTDFRDKQDGWKIVGNTTTVTTDKVITKSILDDTYMKAFLFNTSLRLSCGECKFNKITRQGDITIGDFWGVEEYDITLNDPKGVSVALLNRPNGKKLIEILKKETQIFREVNLETITKWNPNIIGSSKHNENRSKFFINSNLCNLSTNVKSIFDDKCDCMILNLWPANNYGAILTAYGVECLTKKLGFTTKTINNLHLVPQKYEYENSFTQKFAQKYMNLTKPCKTFKDFQDLNNYCNNFIVGSDQVFNSEIIKTHCLDNSEEIYYLNFVSNNNKKLSYAASFGNNYMSSDIYSKELFKHFISQFTAISVRENDGKSILKDSFNIDSEEHIDGAFHIPKSVLDLMTIEYPKMTNYIAYYALPYFDENKNIELLCNTISEKLNIPVKKMNFNLSTTVEEWIAFIKNSDFVITDSYHAIVFSIIFNKRFVQIKNAGTQSRFESLFKVLGIENNSIEPNAEFFDSNKILNDINWSDVNFKLDMQIKKAEEWLYKNLNSTIKNNAEFNLINTIYEQQQLEKIKTKELIESLKELKNELNITKIELCNYNNDNKRHIWLIANSHLYLKKYYKYKILSKFTLGKKRKYYKEKKFYFKNLVSEIRRIKKGM